MPPLSGRNVSPPPSQDLHSLPQRILPGIPASGLDPAILLIRVVAIPRINNVKDPANVVRAERSRGPRDRNRLTSALRCADTEPTHPPDWYRASSAPATATLRLLLRADSPNASRVRPTHSPTNQLLRPNPSVRPSAGPELIPLPDWRPAHLVPVSIEMIHNSIVSKLLISICLMDGVKATSTSRKRVSRCVSSAPRRCRRRPPEPNWFPSAFRWSAKINPARTEACAWLRLTWTSATVRPDSAAASARSTSMIVLPVRVTTAERAKIPTR